MKAIILAAGRGTRLGALTEERPKCLLDIGGTCLLAEQLRRLEAAGIDDVIVVAGHRAERVAAFLRGRCRMIVNPRYAETNAIYSLWLARELAAGETT